MKPGDRFRVRVFKQTVGGTTTSEERLAFLKSQNAVLTGAQGASLVFEEKRDQLPKGYWHTSLDENGRLWKDAGGRRRVVLERGCQLGRRLRLPPRRLRERLVRLQHPSLFLRSCRRSRSAGGVVLRRFDTLIIRHSCILNSFGPTLRASAHGRNAN